MIAIIRAGASGLVVARRGAKVRVYEKNNKIGKKIVPTHLPLVQLKSAGNSISL